MDITFDRTTKYIITFDGKPYNERALTVLYDSEESAKFWMEHYLNNSSNRMKVPVCKIVEIRIASSAALIDEIDLTSKMRRANALKYIDLLIYSKKLNSSYLDIASYFADMKNKYPDMIFSTLVIIRNAKTNEVKTRLKESGFKTSEIRSINGHYFFVDPDAAMTASLAFSNAIVINLDELNTVYNDKMKELNA